MNRRRCTGLALAEDRIVAVEVGWAHGKATARKVAAYGFARGVGWHDREQLGAGLRDFLAEEGIGRTVVVGLPAAWVATATCDVPPVSSEQLSAILKLEAEEVFSLESDQLVIDCCAVPPEGEAGPAALVAASRERLSTVTDVLRGARLRPQAITVSSGVLALAGKGGAGVTVTATSGACEVVRTRDGSVDMMRHVAAGATGGLRAALGHALSHSDDAPDAVALWGSAPGVRRACRDVCDASGVDLVEEPGLPIEGLGAAATEAGVPIGLAASAAALAMACRRRGTLPLDFLHSRLREARRRPWLRRAAWGAAVVLVILAGVVALLADQAAQARQVEQLRARLQQMEPSIQAAREVVDSVNMARGWYDRRPQFLDCLVALTVSFPEQGRIWATSLAVREDMQGVLSGKAQGERLVLSLLDAMKASGQFSEAKLLFIRESRDDQMGSAFAVAFTYKGGD